MRKIDVHRKQEEKFSATKNFVFVCYKKPHCTLQMHEYTNFIIFLVRMNIQNVGNEPQDIQQSNK